MIGVGWSRSYHDWAYCLLSAITKANISVIIAYKKNIGLADSGHNMKGYCVNELLLW